MTENTHSTQEEAPRKDAFNAFVEHETRAVEASVKAVESLLPEGFRDNARVAGREFAAGLKVLVDAAIEGIDRMSREIDEKMKTQRAAHAESAHSAEERPSTTGATKVKVQVE